MAQELNLWKRLQGETPKFFKRIITLSLTLAGVGTALLTCEGLITGFTLPEVLHTLAQWFMVAGIVGTAVSKTTVSTSAVMSMTNEFILDTQTSLFLATTEDGADRWVTGTLNATQFTDPLAMQTKLNSLNTGYPGRYIGAGGVGTPK
jgi:hypothetical protein